MLSVIILMLLCIWGYLKQGKKEETGRLQSTAAGLGVLMVVMSTPVLPMGQTMQNKQDIPVYYCKNTISMAFYRCCSGTVSEVVWCAVLNYTEREYDRRKK